MIALLLAFSAGVLAGHLTLRALARREQGLDIRPALRRHHTRRNP